MLIKNTETRRVEPVLVDRTGVDKAWYYEPWAVAILIGLLALVGLVVYSTVSAPASVADTHSVTRTTITKEVALPTSAPTSTPWTAPSSGTTTVRPNITINNPPATSSQSDTATSSGSAGYQPAAGSGGATNAVHAGSDPSASGDAGQSQANPPNSDSSSNSTSANDNSGTVLGNTPQTANGGVQGAGHSGQ